MSVIRRGDLQSRRRKAIAQIHNPTVTILAGHEKHVVVGPQLLLPGRRAVGGIQGIGEMLGGADFDLVISVSVCADDAAPDLHLVPRGDTLDVDSSLTQSMPLPASGSAERPFARSGSTVSSAASRAAARRWSRRPSLRVGRCLRLDSRRESSRR